MVAPGSSEPPPLPGFRSRYFSPSRLFGRSVTVAVECTGECAGSRLIPTRTPLPWSEIWVTVPALEPAISTSLPG